MRISAGAGTPATFPAPWRCYGRERTRRDANWATWGVTFQALMRALEMRQTTITPLEL